MGKLSFTANPSNVYLFVSTINMFSVLETPEFITSAKKVWTDSERMEFIDWIAENPHVGAVIPESGGLRKVRWSRLGRGKLGGARVVYYLRLRSGTLVLLIAYAKASMDNLRPAFLKKLKEKLDESEW